MSTYRGKHARPSRPSVRVATTHEGAREGDYKDIAKAAGDRGEGSSQPRLRHSRRKTLLVLIPIVVVVVVFVCGGVFVYHTFFETTPVEAGVSVGVSIPEGANTTQIATILKKHDVISDEHAFLQDVQNQHADSSLKPGDYHLVTLMDTTTLINMLVQGPPSTGSKLTVAEGLTLEQTATVVENSCGIKAADFLALARAADTYVADYTFLQGIYDNSLEGFLYPKTYNIPKDADADYVIRTLLDQFAKEISNLDLSLASANGLSLFDVVTVASLIEKETAANKERELVASVIYNRLNLGMRLQIDASVVYALGPSYDGHPLLNVDLEVNSPYNTYRVDTLPAGPICSPRIESIQAAAHPADTDYLYYVLTSKEGFHTFCATSEEFEAAKQVYREVFGIE
ncbi:MAG: endolytic transglycosylase MltG [Coriobacteriales bacterium]|jgi:UPF0755 protein|nr:endolytic transglycosylase MltG [Coriobacteriales bacterium]